MRNIRAMVSWAAVRLFAIFCGLVCGNLFAEVVLPEGEAPRALTAAYFPDRVHEFVWRNWNVVDPARLAKVLGTSAEEVIALAASMGLPPAEEIPPEIKTRGYLSVLRRNWHLLPYSQLLELLEMTPERLDFSLREEDFLWIKLGSLKPKCEPLRYVQPDETARRRAEEIRRVVERDFGRQLRIPVEPRFDFVRQLGSLMPGYVAPVKTDGSVALRFVYSYLAVFGDPLRNPELDPYPDGFLQRLSSVGVNGVWLHVVLRDLAPGGEVFPEFGEGHRQCLANLRKLVERAKRYGVSVYLYMNEPRAMPNEFFEKRPELAGVNDNVEDRPGVAGVKGRALTALCTSRPEVRKWMSDALAYIFNEVPGLGGIYAITASENLTNCASLGQWRKCRHCQLRSDADIIAEVVSTLEEGVHRGSPTARVIVSDWGWRGHGDARDIIARLPKSVWLMSVSEWDLPIERGGVKSKVGEYSISAVGPGPRALRHWDAASKAGVKCAAEIQFNNTCEIPVVPYLSVMDLVAEHLGNLAPRGLSGMLVGWTMGGHPSPNFELARRMNRAGTPEVGLELDRLARDRFGEDGAIHARRAWTLFSDAYRQYPYHIDVIYTSPVTWGAANPMYFERTGFKATMWGLPYDDLEGWRGPYPREVYADQFGKMATGWKAGIEELEKAVEKAPDNRRDEVLSDLRYARAAGVTFQSVANQARFVMARDELAQIAGAQKSEKGDRLRKEICQILECEIELAREQYALVCEDSRIGFEPSCQYFYMPLDLLEKVVNCRWLQERFAEDKSGSGHSEPLEARIWLWGHDRSSFKGTDFGKKLGEEHLDIPDACDRMGIANACVIRWNAMPAEPFEDYCSSLSGLKSFGWSVADGDKSLTFAEKADRVVRLAERFPKLTTVWLDGWFEEDSIRQPVAEIRKLRDRLQMLPQKPKLTIVFQSHEFDKNPKPDFDACDQVSFWLWRVSDIPRADELFARCRALAGADKPIMAAITLWDMEANRPIAPELMRRQLDFVSRKLRSGEASGLVVHCSLMADCELESVTIFREWMAQQGVYKRN